MHTLRAVPFFAFLWVIYNVIVATSGPSALTRGLFNVTLLSGVNWTPSLADALVAVGILFLYLEIFKATGTGVGSVLNHTLSTLVFVAFIVEFLGVGNAGTSTFFLLTLMSFVDVVAGFTVSIVAARRDIALADTGNR